MAAFFAFFTFEDSKGDKSTVEIPLPPTIDLADISDIVLAFGDILNDLVNGHMTNAGLTVNVDVSGITTIAAAVADVQEKARFVFRGVNGFLKSISIPTILESVFVPGTKEVDTTNTDVALFVTAMTSGVSVNSVNVSPTDGRGDDLTELVTAREAWGRSRT